MNGVYGMRKLIALLMALVLLAAPLALAETREMRLGDTGDDVVELQTRLRQLNYYVGKATGTYSDTLAAAVAAVQTAYGIEATGVADLATQKIIYGECYRPLSMNMSGLDVEILQLKLTELNYYWGNITGNYLEGTTSAIATMQNEFGLPPTGIADVETQRLLYACSVRPTPSPTPAPPPTPSPTPYVYRAFPGTLSYGDQNKNVQLVQERLMELGFFTYHKTTTGFYKQTESAVKAFQTYNGIKATGKVDERTWNALFAEEGAVDARSTPKPAAKVPYFFEVDVRNQLTKVWAYDEQTKDYTTLYKTFLCSTGTKSNPTTPGTYTLTGRRARWAEFPNWGGGKAQYWVRIDEYNAFHSLLYTDTDSMALNVSSYNKLGQRASHGCIRLTVADAKWIYDNVEEGMQVWVHEDAPADPELVYISQPGALDKSVMLPVTTPAPPAYSYDPKTPLPLDNRTLKVGSSGQDVYWLQRKLADWGYYEGTATGQFREGTKKAVQAYQKAAKLSSDGIVSKNTFKKLYNDVLDEFATPMPPPVTTPAPTQTVKPK